MSKVKSYILKHVEGVEPPPPENWKEMFGDLKEIKTWISERKRRGAEIYRRLDDIEARMIGMSEDIKSLKKECGL